MAAIPDIDLSVFSEADKAGTVLDFTNEELWQIKDLATTLKGILETAKKRQQAKLSRF